jgi:hypothetical protein
MPGVLLNNLQEPLSSLEGTTSNSNQKIKGIQQIQRIREFLSLYPVFEFKDGLHLHLPENVFPINNARKVVLVTSLS